MSSASYTMYKKSSLTTDLIIGILTKEIKLGIRRKIVRYSADVPFHAEIHLYFSCLSDNRFYTQSLFTQSVPPMTFLFPSTLLFLPLPPLPLLFFLFPFLLTLCPLLSPTKSPSSNPSCPAYFLSYSIQSKELGRQLQCSYVYRMALD